MIAKLSCSAAFFAASLILHGCDVNPSDLQAAGNFFARTTTTTSGGVVASARSLQSGVAFSTGADDCCKMKTKRTIGQNGGKVLTQFGDKSWPKWLTRNQCQSGSYVVQRKNGDRLLIAWLEGARGSPYPQETGKCVMDWKGPRCARSDFDNSNLNCAGLTPTVNRLGATTTTTAPDSVCCSLQGKLLIGDGGTCFTTSLGTKCRTTFLDETQCLSGNYASQDNGVIRLVRWTNAGSQSPYPGATGVCELDPSQSCVASRLSSLQAAGICTTTIVTTTTTTTTTGTYKAHTYVKLTDVCQNPNPISGNIAVTSLAQCQDECDRAPDCIGFDTDSATGCFLKKRCMGTVGSCNGWCGYSRQASVTTTPVQASVLGWVGCYKDTWTRDLNGGPKGKGGYTTYTCAVACKTAGFRYMGVQYGGQCFCGNSYGSYGKKPDSQCGSVCSGEQGKTPKRYCGAGWRNAIFDLKNWQPTPKTTTTITTTSTTFTGTTLTTTTDSSFCVEVEKLAFGDMKNKFIAQHSVGQFEHMQWEDNMPMGGQYQTPVVAWHRSYAMYRYENIPDEMLGSYYLECPRGPARGTDPNAWPGKHTKAGKGMAAGETTIMANSMSYVYIIAETGVVDDNDPYGRFDGGFTGMSSWGQGWTKLDVGPRLPAMFNYAIGDKLPSAAELRGPWAWFEVGGQARFAWRQTCYDNNQDEKLYSSNYFSVWRRLVGAGEIFKVPNSQFWTGGIAFQPVRQITCPATSPTPAAVNSCADLTASNIPGLMEQKSIAVNKPVTGRHAWYAASVAKKMQAIVYNSGNEKILQLLDDSDQITKTLVINVGGASDSVVGVKFTIDGDHLVVAVCQPPGATLVKYSVPSLTEVWKQYQTRTIAVACATISSDYLSVGRTRYVYHHGGTHQGQQSDATLCFRADTGAADTSCREKHASGSQTMLTGFNPQLADPASTRGTAHVYVDAGDASPEKMAVSANWEPASVGGTCRGQEVQSGSTVFQGQRTHFGGLAPKKKGGGFAVTASFSGQGTKFGGNGVEQPPKMFFGTVDKDGIQMTCMKPVLEENGQIGPKAVAISERRFLLGWTKTTTPMGNKMSGTDYGVAQTSVRDSGARLAIVDLYGQLEADPIHLPNHQIPVEVKHLEEDTNGISWIYVQDGTFSATIQLNRIRCQPMAGGPVPAAGR